MLRHVSTVTQPDRNNFAPRIGLAARLPHLFSSTRDTVFRAGYGIYYSPEIAIEAYDLLRNGVRTEINQPGGPTPVLTIEDGFPQTSSTGFPSYFGIDPACRDAVRAAMVGQHPARIARPNAVGTRLCRNERHGPGAVPPLQYAGAR